MKRQVCVVLGGLLLALGPAGACTGTVVASATSAADGAAGGVGTCAQTGAPCSASNPCCSGTCAGGACAVETCGPDGQACTDPGECCAGACTNGVCGAPPPCQPKGSSCASDGECCVGTCEGGVCDGSSCVLEGSSCASNAQCCGETCSAGVCYPNACLAKCVAGNMPAWAKFEGYELKECGCAAGSPCNGACSAACPPGTSTPSTACAVCLDDETGKGSASACTVSAALTDCNQDPTCSPFVQCALACP